MKNISQQFNQQFQPFKALLLYRLEAEDKPAEVYVESYDIGKQGQPINAHPLSIKEMSALNDLLQTSQETKTGYLKSRGIISSKVLYVNHGTSGFAVWYTPPQEVNLFFTDNLHIPSGKTKVPAMVWKASSESLSVYAIKGKARPLMDTKLYHAPFLNIYHHGNVCMGSVRINIGSQVCLEDFIDQWETYFFNSYFSHSINGGSSTKTDTKELWRKLRESGRDFPQNELVKNGLTLKHLLS